MRIDVVVAIGVADQFVLAPLGVRISVRVEERLGSLGRCWRNTCIGSHRCRGGGATAARQLQHDARLACGLLLSGDALALGFGFLRGPAHRIGSGVRGNHPAKLPLALEDRPPEITGKR